MKAPSPRCTWTGSESGTARSAIPCPASPVRPWRPGEASRSTTRTSSGPCSIPPSRSCQKCFPRACLSRPSSYLNLLDLPDGDGPSSRASSDSLSPCSLRHSTHTWVAVPLCGSICEPSERLFSQRSIADVASQQFLAQMNHINVLSKTSLRIVSLSALAALNSLISFCPLMCQSWLPWL